MRKINGKIRSNKIQSKYRRKLHLRAKLSGTSTTPRVCVTKTNKNLYIQAMTMKHKKPYFRFSLLAKALR